MNRFLGLEWRSFVVVVGMLTRNSYRLGKDVNKYLATAASHSLLSLSAHILDLAIARTSLLRTGSVQSVPCHSQVKTSPSGRNAPMYSAQTVCTIGPKPPIRALSSVLYSSTP